MRVEREEDQRIPLVRRHLLDHFVEVRSPVAHCKVTLHIRIPQIMQLTLDQRYLGSGEIVDRRASADASIGEGGLWSSGPEAINVN